MPPDRAAGHSAASFSGRAGWRSGMLLPRYRDCGNSAEVRRRPGDAPMSGPHRSSRRLSLRPRSGVEQADRANLIGPARIGGAEVSRDVERSIEIFAIDDIEAEQLLLDR